VREGVGPRHGRLPHRRQCHRSVLLEYSQTVAERYPVAHHVHLCGVQCHPTAADRGLGTVLDQPRFIGCRNIPQQPSMQYSAELARDVEGRELAAYSVLELLLAVAQDEDIDDQSRIMAGSLAREFDAVLKIVEVLTDNPMHSARMLLDGPL